MRMLAAQGGFAPRAHEQLSILVLLLEDPDPEIRQTADDTLNRLPAEALVHVSRAARRLGRPCGSSSPTAASLPAATPAEDADAPLVDVDVAEPGDEDLLAEGDDDRDERQPEDREDDLHAAAEGRDEGHARDARDPGPRHRTR